MKSLNSYILFEENKALEQTLALYQNSLSGLTLEKGRPDEQAIVTYGLANALTTSEQETEESPEQRQNEIALLEQALQIFENALEQLDQEDSPQDWASTQNNLAGVLHALGQRQRDSKRLKKAIDTYTAALQVWTREQAPKQWARCMNSLGVALYAHGAKLKGDRTLEKSVVAYKNVFAERTMEDEPLEWAMTQNNLGAALQLLGEREQSPQRMEEAIHAYERTLEVWREQQLTMNLAALAMSNLGAARMAFAELTNDAGVAQKAADDLMLLVEVFSSACPAQYLERSKVQLENAETLVESLGAI